MFKIGDSVKFLGRTSDTYVKDTIYKISAVVSEKIFFVTTKRGQEKWDFSFHSSDQVRGYWIKVASSREKKLPEWW